MDGTMLLVGGPDPQRQIHGALLLLEFRTQTNDA